MSFSAHIDNKKKDILVLGIGPTQGLEHALTAEKMDSINFTVTKKKVCLSLHYNGANSCLFVNGTEIFVFVCWIIIFIKLSKYNSVKLYFNE